MSSAGTLAGLHLRQTDDALDPAPVLQRDPHHGAQRIQGFVRQAAGPRAVVIDQQEGFALPDPAAHAALAGRAIPAGA